MLHNIATIFSRYFWKEFTLIQRVGRRYWSVFLGFKSHTINGGSTDNCKIGLVKYFKLEHKLCDSNNPAQHPRIKQIVSGVKEVWKRTGKQTDSQAFPITVHYLKLNLTGLSDDNVNRLSLRCLTRLIRWVRHNVVVFLLIVLGIYMMKNFP